MAKYNAKSPGTKTINLAGGAGYKTSDKLELAQTLLTTFVQSTYYRSEQNTIKQIEQLIAGLKDKKFAAKAAIYARTKVGMRSITHITAAEIAHSVKGEKWTKKFIAKVIYRPDDVTEILSYYAQKYGKPIPHSILRGIALGLGKFDAYQLAKYRGEGHNWKLIDAVNLAHPVPTKTNKEGLEKLVKDELRSTQTWERNISDAGQVDTHGKSAAEVEQEKLDNKRAAWGELIKTKKLGYFALLRNLRNIESTDQHTLDSALEMLVDPTLIKKSMVMPFQFQTALQEVGARESMAAISKAIDIACQNVPKLGGKTVVCLDISGSMQGRVSEIGSLFAAVLAKSNDADIVVFDDSARYIKYNPLDSTTTIAKSLRINGGGTNFQSIFSAILRTDYENIIILSDMQGWAGYDRGRTDQAYKYYQANQPGKHYVFSFNLQDYGTLMFPEQNVFCLAGWSDKVFDILGMLKEDPQALVHEIEKIEIE